MDQARPTCAAWTKDIGDKLKLKFKHVRDAFRPLNLQRLGKINREEMRSFFRGFGHPKDVADRVFDLLQDKAGEVEYAVFMSHFESVLGRDFRQLTQAPIIALEDPLASLEVDGTIEAFKAFLMTKCRNLQEAYRILDYEQGRQGQLSGNAKLCQKAWRLGTSIRSAVLRAGCGQDRLDQLPAVHTNVS